MDGFPPAPAFFIRPQVTSLRDPKEQAGVVWSHSRGKERVYLHQETQEGCNRWYFSKESFLEVWLKGPQIFEKLFLSRVVSSLVQFSRLFCHRYITLRGLLCFVVSFAEPLKRSKERFARFPVASRLSKPKKTSTGPPSFTSFALKVHTNLKSQNITSIL